jgi:hypothetical protein
MSKLVFQLGKKNKYKKTCNILENGFTKSYSSTKKKSIFLKLKQTGP